MFKRSIIITENQLRNIFLTENRASKNQSLARKMVRTIDPDVDEKVFTKYVLQSIPNVRKADFHLYPAVVRFILGSDEYVNANTIIDLNKFIGVIAPKSKELGLDQNANGMSITDFFNTFESYVESYNNNEKKGSSLYSNDKRDYNGYNIIPIPNFEKASEYKDYTDWCITNDENAFYNYTNKKNGIFYFLLKNGFENVPKEQGENCPLDEYGLSMIAVSFRIDGSISSITCRWNHNNGGNDTIMSPTQLSKIINNNIYSIFDSNDIENSYLNNMKIIYANYRTGIYLCQELITNDLFVTDSFFFRKGYFLEKPYTLFNGLDNDEGDINILITNQGKILEFSKEENTIKCVEKDNMLFVANKSDTGTDGGIYDLKTFKKIPQYNFKIDNIEEMGQVVFFTTRDYKQYIYNGGNNGKQYFEEINRITKTKNNQLLVFLSENDLTIINENTGEILFNNRKIISNTFNTTFYCDSGDGKNIYAISKVNGILNTEPINTLYQIYSEDKQELNGMYIALTTKENLLLNNDGNFIDYIDKNQINEINKFNTLNKVNLMQTIANMSNIRPARKRRV